MTIEETTQLLVHIQVVDNRQIEEITILEWHQLVEDEDLPTALEALRMHRTESAGWVMPFHIIRNAQRIRNAPDQPEDEWGNPLTPDALALKARARLGGIKAMTR